MTKFIALCAVLFAAIGHSFGHFMWIETNQIGKINQEQQIDVFFGEFSYGMKEEAKGDSFTKVKEFTLRVVHSSGESVDLEAVANGDHYTAKFTPKQEGTYTVIMNNDQINVYDLTRHNFGIFKAHYHATAKIQVGEKSTQTIVDNPNGITIKNVSTKTDKAELLVLYKGKALTEAEFTVFMPDKWSRSIKTDANGMVSFDLPFETTYVVEATFKDETTGTFKGTDYQFVWHCCSLSIKL